MSPVAAQEVLHLHVQWQGPLPFDAVAALRGPTDYGLYQICGPHPVYGRNLLYVGKAQEQPFGVRLQQEGWAQWQEANGAVEVYVGRLSGSDTPHAVTWSALISRAERLLIAAHRPAHNASGLYTLSDPEAGWMHVLNWGDRGALLPEASGARWSGRFAVIPSYGAYGSHGQQADPLTRETLA